MTRRTVRSAKETPAIHYRVALASLHAHLFEVTLTIDQPQASQRVSLPVWIPGSYLVREFSKNLQGLQAQQAKRKLSAQPLDKCSWLVACDPATPLVLSYQVYALDNSVRTAWLDSARGFFNATSLCLRVEGQEDSPHELELVAATDAPNWSVCTGLAAHKINRRGFGTYRANDYDELADCPVEMGNFWRGSFVVAGVEHTLTVAGAAPSVDTARLLADTQKICEAEIKFWHGQSMTRTGKASPKPPFASYAFMLNATDDNYGGLEHRNSCALICSRKDLPRLSSGNKNTNKSVTIRASKPSDGYTTLLGLISHEYFHSWNVKRLRPWEFAKFDYTQENYTELLWFFEGFTSYYDDLLLRRANLIDDAAYLKLLNKTINQVMQTPGRLVQSVAQASFDAWTKFYRPDENTPNATVSYYSKGALVALCIDLTLRLESAYTLDDVMRGLWQRTHGGPMREDDLLAVLHELSSRSWQRELKHWVHSTRELPVRELMEQHGVAVSDEPAQLAQQLGLRVHESAGLQIKSVLRGGAAEHSGFCAGDEWLGIEVGTGNAAQTWRIHQLDELALYVGANKRVKALVSRDKKILQLPLAMPSGGTTWQLTPHDREKITRWLAA